MTIILWPQNLMSCQCRMQKQASSNKMLILLKFLKGPEMRLKTLNRKRQNLILSLCQVLPQRWHKDQISSTLMTFSTGLGASSSLATTLRRMNSSHQKSQNSKRLISLLFTVSHLTIILNWPKIFNFTIYYRYRPAAQEAKERGRRWPTSSSVDYRQEQFQALKERDYSSHSPERQRSEHNNWRRRQRLRRRQKGNGRCWKVYGN